MTISWELLLYVLAAVCFVLAGIGVPTGRINLIATGLLLWVLVPLLHAAGAK